MTMLDRQAIEAVARDDHQAKKTRQRAWPPSAWYAQLDHRRRPRGVLRKVLLFKTIHREHLLPQE